MLDQKDGKGNAIQSYQYDSLAHVTTVTDALLYFDAAIKGTRTRLVPWLQDFSHADVQAQIDAARSLGTNGFLLWNPLGVYTTQALNSKASSS